jgi:hypothetical protein
VSLPVLSVPAFFRLVVLAFIPFLVLEVLVLSEFVVGPIELTEGGLVVWTVVARRIGGRHPYGSGCLPGVGPERTAPGRIRSVVAHAAPPSK